jgi:hypothetical protein
LPGTDRAAVAATKHETPSDFLAHYLRRTRRSPDELADYLFVAFVRDPVDRFASLHRYLLADTRSKPQGLLARLWPAFARTKRQRRYPHVPPTLDGFARLLADPPAWTQTIRSLRPQTDYTAGITPFVGRFEALSADFGLLCERLGVSLALPHVNASRPASSLKPAGADLSPQALAILQRHYASDYAAFGYTPPQAEAA